MLTTIMVAITIAAIAVAVLTFLEIHKGNKKKYLTEGKVIEKNCQFSHTKVFSIPQLVNCGTVTQTINIPHSVTYPDIYVITISKANAESNKPLTQDIYVSKEIFESTNIGDEFTYNKDRGDLFELPYDCEFGWSDRDD